MTTNPYPGLAGAWDAKWSPDGGKVVFRADWDSDNNRSDIYVISAAGGAATRLTTDPSRTNSSPCWSPDGEEIAFCSELQGGYAHSELRIMNAADGSNVTMVTSVDDFIRGLDWSRDGTRILYSEGAMPTFHIYTISPAGGTPVQLTSGRYSDGSPAWSPDGTQIAFDSNRSGSEEVWLMSADGQGAIQLTHSGPGSSFVPRWSPAGQRIAFSYRPSSADQFDIWAMSATGQNLVQLTSDPALDEKSDWSPDGGWIVFTSKRTGHYELWVLSVVSSPLLYVEPVGQNQARFQRLGAAHQRK